MIVFLGMKAPVLTRSRDARGQAFGPIDEAARGKRLLVDHVVALLVVALRVRGTCHAGSVTAAAVVSAGTERWLSCAVAGAAHAKERIVADANRGKVRESKGLVALSLSRVKQSQRGSLMLHHVSVGVRDVERAARFYDAVLATLGYRRVMEFMPYAVAYGDRAPEFWVQLPADRNPASVGNGVHIGFTAKSKAMVEAFHRAAVAAGGADEGAAGPRPDYGPAYFGAFVRDLDGNKLEALLTAEPVVATTRPKAKANAKAKTQRRKAGKAKARRKKGKAPKTAKRKTGKRK